MTVSDSAHSGEFAPPTESESIDPWDAVRLARRVAGLVGRGRSEDVIDDLQSAALERWCREAPRFDGRGDLVGFVLQRMRWGALRELEKIDGRRHRPQVATVDPGQLVLDRGEQPYKGATIEGYWHLARADELAKREILLSQLDSLRIRRGVAGRRFDAGRVLLEWKATERETVTAVHSTHGASS